jgi:dynein heavy chain 1
MYPADISNLLALDFLKLSELRFGNPLLIQDVEHLDPILSPVLNREIRRSDGN